MSLIGPEGRKQLQLAAGFLAVGLELAVAIIVGRFGGAYLDKLLGTAPYLEYVGLFLGIAAGFRSLIVLARKAQREAGKTSQEPDKSEAPRNEPNDTP